MDLYHHIQFTYLIYLFFLLKNPSNSSYKLFIKLQFGINAEHQSCKKENQPICDSAV